MPNGFSVDTPITATNAAAIALPNQARRAFGGRGIAGAMMDKGFTIGGSPSRS
ncbi:hypothetical protein [Sphingopyxis sp.]|uniref:hypothetical protein n=1 Tax=Sphingopyxis sp. TaxID=1908224 RepID=UPI0025E310CC|nr:hypothetical protein [Sphingopyxis sp.]MBK6413241.1 hypothetical protein [Sphingopyxis sp.]